MSVPPIPEGYHTVTPYLIVEDLPKLITFLENAFCGKVREKITMPDGRVTHAEVLIGNSHIMMGSASPEFPALPCMLYLYTEDVDGWYKKAIAAGAQSVMEPAVQTYGNKDGGVMGPLGNYWWIATQVEEVSSEELYRREVERVKAREEGQ